ncbi:MAG TPA: hypothetical protein VI216_11035 [Candidatus Acidoferrales bacterium]
MRPSGSQTNKPQGSTIKPSAGWIISVYVLSVVCARPLLAFAYPLSSQAIREAYFLAAGDPSKRLEFFEKYKHRMPTPISGPDVSLIEVQTPFACIVDEIAGRISNYHAADAERDYLGKPGCFRVHVEIDFSPTWPQPTDTAATRSDFWKRFKVRLKQRSEISPRSIRGRPIYNTDALLGFTGATIDLEYNVRKIDPSAITTVDVDTPDGQQVETTFNLNSLR